MHRIETFPAKRLLTPLKATNDHFFSSNYTCNLYRGCNHGCIYCDSRSECYQIDRFDTVRLKENALSMLRDELSRKRGSGVVSMGATSDPYNIWERKLRVTRGALKLLLQYGFGISMSTKSALVSRDADILNAIGKQNPAVVSFSITTADDELAKFIEPRASSSTKRFEAMEILAKNDVFTGTWMNPMMPFLTDDVENMKKIIHMTKEHGGQFVICFFRVTLRTGDREYFYHALDQNPTYQGVKKQYIDTFGLAYECASPKAKELYEIFRSECKSAGLYWNLKDLNQAAVEKCPKQISMF